MKDLEELTNEERRKLYDSFYLEYHPVINEDGFYVSLGITIGDRGKGLSVNLIPMKELDPEKYSSIKEKLGLEYKGFPLYIKAIKKIEPL